MAETPFDILESLRNDKWTIAVHNDYRLTGVSHTFYLFTHPAGICVKGEGTSDLIALTEARRLATIKQNALISAGQIESIKGILERGESALGKEFIYPWAPDVRALYDAYITLFKT